MTSKEPVSDLYPELFTCLMWQEALLRELCRRDRIDFRELMGASGGASQEEGNAR